MSKETTPQLGTEPFGDSEQQVRHVCFKCFLCLYNVKVMFCKITCLTSLVKESLGRSGYGHVTKGRACPALSGARHAGETAQALFFLQFLLFIRLFI